MRPANPDVLDLFSRPAPHRREVRIIPALGMVLLCLLAPGLQPATAQEEAHEQGGSELTLEELLQRNVEARGGYEAWKKVETVRMTGSVEAAGESNPLRVEFKRPKSFRIETEVQGEPAVQGYDGKIAWVEPPFAGQAFRLPEEAAEGAAEQADFEGPLMDHEAKGLTLELAGREEVDGRETYRIDYSGENGRKGSVFLDPETFLEVRQTSERTVQGQDVEVEINLRDYKEVGGLKVAHTIEQQLSMAPEPQVIRVDEIEVNVELDDDRFAFPGEG